MKRTLRRQLDEVDRQGLKFVRIEWGGKHPKVYVITPDGREQWFTISMSPSDNRDAVNLRARLKRLARAG